MMGYDRDGMTAAEAKRTWAEVLDEDDPWERMAIVREATAGRPVNAPAHMLITMVSILNCAELDVFRGSC